MTRQFKDAKKLAKTNPQAACDLIVARAAELMVEFGASIPLVLDRLLTYSAAQACSMHGSLDTAAIFRKLADNIEAGCFHSVTGEGQPTDKRVH